MERQRRVKGTGSIHFRPRTGQWCGQVEDGWVDGKRRRRTVYGKTREEVETSIAEVLAARGVDVDAVQQEALERPPTTLEIARAKATHTVEEWRLKLALVGRCVYCGSDADLVMDHATPISRGGDDSLGNVVPACAPCNRSKGADTAAEFLVRRIMDGRS